MSAPIERFDQLGLAAPLLSALETVGYETPSPIQAACIPHLLAGSDLLGEAQTGTGKTAAFALPVLSRIDISLRMPQALILTPTRELAIQVAEACQKYAHNLPGFHVLPLYGGQSMVVQLRQLERGAHVIIGTPGRVMDHLERKSLKLDHLKTLVLDEADEMLRMGFIDDVEWILEHTPAERQTALFSATMPEAIRRVAHRHLRNPQEVKIKAATSTVTTIRQRYWQVSGANKLDALTRILEVEEDFDAAIVFVRTKTATVELAEKLEARGYAAAALNGDMQQAHRERTIEQLKNERLDIVVATDVAARGIDVPRVSHVINYDIPYDTEAYVHRIGRTGRAGRTGDAILFISPREKRMLRIIEAATKQRIEPMQLPSEAAVASRRVAQFKRQIVEALTEDNLTFFEDVVTQIASEQNIEVSEVAAALAWMVQRDRPLLPDTGFEGSRDIAAAPAAVASTRLAGNAAIAPAAAIPAPITTPGADPNDPWKEAREAKRLRKEAERASKVMRAPQEASRSPWSEERSERPRRDAAPRFGNVRYRIAVGRDQGVMPKDIVGAIANEAGIESRFIGQINLFDEYSTVDLPDSLPADVISVLKRLRIKGKPADTRPDDGGDEGFSSPRASTRKPWDAPRGEQKPYGKPAFEKRSFGGDKPFEKKPFEKKPFESRPFEKKPFEKKPFEGKPWEKKPWGDAPRGEGGARKFVKRRDEK